jgi:hypothetical protein
MEQFSDNEAGMTVLPCGKRVPAHWIEIELLGEDDSPVPDVEYQVVLPNGDVAHGFLDEKGKARIKGIPSAGECKVTFPGMDKDAWKPVS